MQVALRQAQGDKIFRHHEEVYFKNKASMYNIKSKALSCRACRNTEA